MAAQSQNLGEPSEKMACRYRFRFSHS
jgi:hypothetical protein